MPKPVIERLSGQHISILTLVLASQFYDNTESLYYPEGLYYIGVNETQQTSIHCMARTGPEGENRWP